MFKKLTEGQERIKQISNCFNCAFRTPLNNNPVACIWGIRDKWFGEKYAPCNHPNCDRWISDIKLEKHLKTLLHIQERDDNK